MARTFFVGGNFKMNPDNLQKKVDLVENLAKASLDPNVEVVIAPPSLYLLPAKQILGDKPIQLAAQNCYTKESGAFTGEISAKQLADAGIPFVILGHSERRTIFKETSEFVAEKTKVAIDAGLSVILCIGETLEERDAGKTIGVVQTQLQPVVQLLGKDQKLWSKVVIAYEPVWAIGTGRVATPEQAQDVHKEIRKFLTSEVSPEIAESTRIIYGGSVTAASSKDLGSQPDIDGFLVGGASLKPEFVDIVNVNKAV